MENSQTFKVDPTVAIQVAAVEDSERTWLGRPVVDHYGEAAPPMGVQWAMFGVFGIVATNIIILAGMLTQDEFRGEVFQAAGIFRGSTRLMSLESATLTVLLLLATVLTLWAARSAFNGNRRGRVALSILAGLMVFSGVDGLMNDSGVVLVISIVAVFMGLVQIVGLWLDSSRPHFARK